MYAVSGTASGFKSETKICKKRSLDRKYRLHVCKLEAFATINSSVRLFLGNHCERNFKQSFEFNYLTFPQVRTTF